MGSDLQIIHNVVSRFKVADAIGDPATLLRQFEAAVVKFADLEPILQRTKEAKKVVEEGASHPHYQEASEFLGSHRYDFLFRVTNGYAALHRAGGHDLFLSLLQQLDLPPKVRKAVEAAAKFYSKSRVQKPPRGQEAEVYEKHLAVYRDQLELAKTAISQNKPRGQGGTDTGSKAKQAGPFTLINTGGFDDGTMEEAAKIVEKAADLLARKGLSKVCYGEVLLSNTLHRSTVLAFYLVEKDEMFIRANLKGKQHDAVQTTLHELAHRLHFKFLKSQDGAIRMMHFNISRKERERLRNFVSDPTLRPKSGDTMTTKGKVYEVTRVVYDKVYLVRQDDPKTQATIPLAGWIRNKGLDTSQHVTGFVTPYAAKNHEENFAEMVAFYCLDKLPDDQVEMLKAVL